MVFLRYIIVLSFAASTAAAQTDGLLQIDDAPHRYLEKQLTLGRLTNAHLSHKPLSTYEARRYLDRLTSNLPPPISKGLGPFYRNGHDLWSVEGDNYGVQLNPLLYLTLGSADGNLTWRNTRGVRASGHVGPHVFFEARLEETQEHPALMEFDRRTAPRLPFVRTNADTTIYDYQIGTGVVGFRSEHFEIRFGRDRTHWGPGEGSLILSDYSSVADQLQIRTTFWRIQYVNLFAAFTALQPFGFIPPNIVHPRKYGAFHRLSVNVSPRVNLEIFESVIFGTDSTSGRSGEFDPAYLNPVILYRTVEADRGSPDNVLLGAGASWIPVNGLRVYGQVLLDEFIASKLFTSDWTSRWGLLAGFHAVPLEQLSIRGEYARLRPYLYTHRSATTAYLHYLDQLGHPAGPNAVDYAIFVDYRPLPRWHGAMNLSFTRRGRNPAFVNVGADPRVSFDTRASDDADMLSGIRQHQFMLEAYAGYELLPQLYLEAALRMQHVEDEVQEDVSYVEPYVSLRWGLPIRSLRF